MSKSLGIILRSYAKTPEVVDEVIDRALKSAEKLSILELLPEILFVVPIDFDCRMTAGKLRLALKKAGLPGKVLEATGHHSCGALNQGLRFMQAQGVDYVAVISNKAMSYMNSAVTLRAISALEAGRRVVGVQIKELEDIEELSIENTFCFWNVSDLCEVGGFDCETGVEEVAPMIRLMEEFENCVGLLQGHGELDIRKSADGLARHKEVRETKASRQRQQAERFNHSLDAIKEKIIPL